MGKNAVEAMFVLNFTIDGIPMIYNGNEVADFARHNHNKFSEDEVSYQNIDWQNALLKSGRDRLAFMKNLIRIRKSNLALYEGNTIWLENSEPQNILSFARLCKTQKLLCFINASDKSADFTAKTNLKPQNTIIERDSKLESATDGEIKISLGPYGFYICQAK